MKNRGPSLVNCDHSFIYCSNSKELSVHSVKICTKCECTKKTFWSGKTTYSEAPLSDLLGISKEGFRLGTNIQKGIILLKRKYATEYFAKKKGFEVANLMFITYKNLDSVFIEIAYQKGLVQVDISREDFKRFCEDSYLKPSNSGVYNSIMKKDVLLFASMFTKSRLSRYVTPGSKFESFLATLTGNKQFI